MISYFISTIKIRKNVFHSFNLNLIVLLSMVKNLYKHGEKMFIYEQGEKRMIYGTYKISDQVKLKD